MPAGLAGGIDGLDGNAGELKRLNASKGEVLFGRPRPGCLLRGGEFPVIVCLVGPERIADLNLHVGEREIRYTRVAPQKGCHRNPRPPVPEA